MHSRNQYTKLVALPLATLLLLLTVVSAMAEPGLSPPLVEATIADGDSLEVEKTVTTPEFPPLLDACFLADTTGSMGPALANVQANIGSIMTTVAGGGPDAQFCAAQYQDAGDSPEYALDQDLTANQAAVQTAVDAWAPGDGGD